MEGKVITSNNVCQPAEAGYQGERLEVLNKHFQEMIDKKELLSASYCLSRNGKIFADAALGKFSYEEEDQRPFTPDTIFGIASITKLFTAVAILKLVEDGRMRLDQCVGEFIEEFNTPPYNQITIVHLLTHTSGIIADEGAHENKYYMKWWKLVKENPSEEWIKAVLTVGLQNKPGTEWSYSSVGFSILGEVITRVSGMFCEDYIQKYIIDPCDMKDTCFGRKVEWIDRYNIRTDWMKRHLETLRDKDSQSDDWNIPNTGGGIFSTCRDLMKFGTMLVNQGTYNGKRIIGRKALEAMARVHTSPSVVDFCWGAKGVHRPYGLGPDVFMESNKSQLITPGVFSHEGFGTCCLAVDVKEQFVAVWSAQFFDGDWYAHALRNVASIMWSGIE